MTAPVLAYKKFWIVKPQAATNQIKNPAFAAPDYVEDWTAVGTGVTLAECGDEQRRGAYSMQVNTATGESSGAYYAGLSVTSGLDYTFSCDVNGVSGQAMRIVITDASDVVKATTTWTATGYWERKQVTHTSAESAATYRVRVLRDAVASTAPFYVDGAQFEQASAASTFFDGTYPGCRWTGLARNSSSYRSNTTGYGGKLLDFSTYCDIVSVAGLGHGDWNQILTKMTSGGDLYQTHTRKSRQFTIVVDFIGDTLGAIETNRKAIIDAIRPDLLEGQERVIRYQGFAANGDEATNPIDIVCVPLAASLVDTPDIPSHQRAVLNFMIPTGLLEGAYNDGATLEFKADFPAEFIVKRDATGNWVSWNGSSYNSMITGLNGSVLCMAEGPDGKIYVGGAFTDAGGTTDADYLARWNGTTWEAVVAGLNSGVSTMAFDANKDLYIGGYFTNLGSTDGDYIVKITDLSGTPTINALGTGTNNPVSIIAINSNGDVYAGGLFSLAGAVENTTYIAKWNGTTWSALSTGLDSTVSALAFAPNGDLYIGGAFTDAAYPRLCKWNGTAFSVVGTNTNIGGIVYALAFGATGSLYVGGSFTNAGGIANADYIAKWTGSKWESLGTGTNGTVYKLTVNNGKVYVSGYFTTAGGLTLTDRIAVWSNGAWQPLDIDLPGAGIIYSALPASDGSLYIGGAFSTAGETPDVNAECGIVSNRVYTVDASSSSANTYPEIKVTGPGTLKALTNHTTGKSVAFDGLTLQAGETISLSFDPINLKFKGDWEGRGNVMRYVIAGSDFGNFYLKPGSNAFSLFMTGTTTASGATITWKPKLWGLDGALL